MPPLKRVQPLCRRLANEIRTGIESGRYPPESQLPSETALETQYGTSRPTVRQALATLKAEGLIRVEHGKGSFVVPREVPSDELRDVMALTDLSPSQLNELHVMTLLRALQAMRQEIERLRGY